MRFIHYDEAKRAAVAILSDSSSDAETLNRILLVSDLFGKLRVIWWGTASESWRAPLMDRLQQACGPWWTNTYLEISSSTDVESKLWEAAWSGASPVVGFAKLRVLNRHRTRTLWSAPVGDSLWRAPSDGPPIIVFYGFKGGLGRTTTLASFAIQQARVGARVCVVDYDLDAPGIGSLLAADASGLTSPWGVVDFLLEHDIPGAQLVDYYHKCNRVSDDGEIIVFPAGQLNESYVEKLARIDLEQMPLSRTSGLAQLLLRIKGELNPNWILIDGRTGVSEAAGQLLSGIGHLHVLLGATGEQNWRGLSIVIDRLGRQRLNSGLIQSEVLLVQGLVPPGSDGAQQAIARFEERAREVFSDLYYAEAPDDPSDDRFWDVLDMESDDSPHRSMPISYDQRLTDFRDISDVMELLASSHQHLDIAARIAARFDEGTL